MWAERARLCHLSACVRSQLWPPPRRTWCIIPLGERPSAPEQVSACPCAALPARRLAAGPVQRAQCASTGSPGEGGAAAPAAATDAARWTAGTPKRGSGTRAREEGEAVGTEQMPRRTGSALRLQGLRGTARHVPAGASASSSCQGRGTLCCQSPLQLVAWWCTTVASSLDWMCCAPVC